jgi:hypothetical protein
MAPHLVPGWLHNPGWHCASTALSDATAFLGHPLSEAMCFGLGAGLGFAYLKGEVFYPTRFTATRSRILETNFFENLGIARTWLTVPDPDQALKKAKAGADQGIPLLMRADIYHLDYYQSQAHFPGHVILFWGYDDEAGAAFVADTERPGLQTVAQESLKKARFSNLPGYPVQGDHIPVDWAPPSSDLRPALRRALRKQARDLFKPEYAQAGIFGFPALARAVTDLSDWGGAEDWQWSARWFYQVIEKRGTGGGAFRRLYARFLEEAAALIPELAGLAPAREMFAISERWSELSRLLKEISERDRPEGFGEAAERLAEIFEREQALMDKIQGLGESG